MSAANFVIIFFFGAVMLIIITLMKLTMMKNLEDVDEMFSLGNKIKNEAGIAKQTI